MTCREKLKIEHPELINSYYSGGCANCPSSYGYLDKPPYCHGEIEIDPHICDACWDREIPENKPVYSTPEEKETSGLSIEIVYSDFSSDVLSGVKYFELIKEARMLKIEHIDSDIYTFIPAEHVIRIGKIWEDVD